MDLDAGVSYNAAPTAIQRLLAKVKARKKAAGEGETNQLSNKLDHLIQFADIKYPKGVLQSSWRKWKKGTIRRVGNRPVGNAKDLQTYRDQYKQLSPHVEDIAKGFERFRFISGKLDELIQLDSNGPPRNNTGYKIKPLGKVDNLYTSDDGGIYTPTHGIKTGSDILNYPHLQHGKFTKIIDRKGRPTYESRKQAKVLGAIGGGLVGAAGGTATGYGLHAALESGRMGRHSGKIGAAVGAAGPIIGAAIGYRRGSKKILPQDQIQNRLSAKLDELIQFDGDPRPRNPLGEFTGQEEGGPNPNSMVKTYRVAPAQPGMAPNKSGGPGILGAGGLSVLGGAGGALGSAGAKGALDKIGKALKQARKR